MTVNRSPNSLAATSQPSTEFFRHWVWNNQKFRAVKGARRLICLRGITVHVKVVPSAVYSSFAEQLRGLQASEQHHRSGRLDDAARRFERNGEFIEVPAVSELWHLKSRLSPFIDYKHAGRHRRGSADSPKFVRFVSGRFRQSKRYQESVAGRRVPE